MIQSQTTLDATRVLKRWNDCSFPLEVETEGNRHTHVFLSAKREHHSHIFTWGQFHPRRKCLSHSRVALSFLAKNTAIPQTHITHRTVYAWELGKKKGILESDHCEEGTREDQDKGKHGPPAVMMTQKRKKTTTKITQRRQRAVAREVAASKKLW